MMRFNGRNERLMLPPQREKVCHQCGNKSNAYLQRTPDMRLVCQRCYQAEYGEKGDKQ